MRILFNTENPSDSNAGGGSIFSPQATADDKADVLSKGTLSESTDEGNPDVSDDPSNEISLENAADIFDQPFKNKQSQRRASGPLQKTNNNGEKTLKPGRMQQYDSVEEKEAAAAKRAEDANAKAMAEKGQSSSQESEDSSGDVDSSEQQVEQEGEGEETTDAGEETQGKETRDYTGLDEKTTNYLKRLPNGVYKHVRPLVTAKLAAEKELGEVKEALTKLKSDPNRIPDNWHDHEQAFTLSPEYSKIAANYNAANIEAQHWQNQLIAIEQSLADPENAIPWFDLARNPQTGEYTNGKEYKASIQAKYQVNAAYQKALQLQSQYATEATNLQKGFAQKIVESKSYYKQFDKHFEPLLDELKPKPEHVKAFKDILHPFDKESRTAELGGKMFSLILNQGQMINKLQAELKRVRGNSNDTIAAGAKSKPSQKVAAGGKASASSKNMVDVDSLMEEMRG